MVSPTLSQLLERARVRFGVEVEILDSTLKNLYPEGGTDLTRMIEGSTAIRSSLLDALAAGRPHRLEGAGQHYRIYPLTRSSRPRQSARLVAIRHNQVDDYAVPDIEPWSDLAQAIVEADLTVRETLSDERQRSRRLTGALAFVEFLTEAVDEVRLAEALVHAAAVWYDVDARVYRRDLAGDLVLHTWLPGVQPDPGAQVLKAHLFGSDMGPFRLESGGELGDGGSGHEAVLVPLASADRADWVLALIGTIPPEADAVLRLIGRVAGTQLAALAVRRSSDARARFEVLLNERTKAPELLAMRVVRDLAESVGASAVSLTLVRNGGARRIAAVGSVTAHTAPHVATERLYSADRFVRGMALGANDFAVFELTPAPGTTFTPEAAEIAEACAAVMRTWLAGSLSSFDMPVHLSDSIAPGAPGFSARIQEELERARRFNLRLCLILIDVAAPSETMAQLRDALRRALRGSDVTGTMSGTKLAALLTHTDALGLDNVVRRVKQRMADAAERLQVSDLKLGQAAVSPEVRTADALLELALRHAEPVIVH
jgi:hypothetical protein